MSRESPLGLLSELGAPTHGVFRGRAAVKLGVTRKQLNAFMAGRAIVRVLPDTYRMAAVAPSCEQSLRAALMWAGDDAAAAVRSAGTVYSLQGVTSPTPEIVVPRERRPRINGVVVHHPENRAALTLRTYRGFRTTGVEATLLALAGVLDDESFEIACEDARRRRLTSVPALQAYVDCFGSAGRRGTGKLRQLLRELDPQHPSRSTLEVKARRLLVANGVTGFAREFPLTWNGRTYYFDFAFAHPRAILETNGRRWHDDPADYEDDNEKWSVPGRHGYRVVFATWDKVTNRPADLLAELAATLAA